MLLDFLREARLDRVGCFTYSPVDGARANDLPAHVPEEVKQERRARLMAVQAEISARRLREKVGKVMTVLVDAVEGDRAVARSSADAPEIDGVVYIEKHPALKQGEFATVRITGAGTHDLWARVAAGKKRPRPIQLHLLPGGNK
jgi:ribosomal protein S12 methylthiotransferase